LLKGFWIDNITGLNRRSGPSFPSVIPQNSTWSREQATSTAVGLVSVLNDGGTTKANAALLAVCGASKLSVEELHHTENVSLFQPERPKKLVRDIRQIFLAHLVPMKGHGIPFADLWVHTAL